MSDRRAATRYAEALFDLADARGMVDDLRAELQDLAGLVRETPSLQVVLERPDLDSARKLEVVRGVLGEKFSDTITALLSVLLEHDRGEEVATVAGAFAEFADEAAGVVRAEAHTVIPLSTEQRRRLRAALSRLTGRRVVLEEQADAAVVAGVRVWVGDRLIDGSAAGRLARMREELVSVQGRSR